MVKKKIDADLAQSQIALKRAALRAREIAERTGTPLVTYKNGQVHKNMVVREEPDTKYR
jgi:LDH2 family malate/lactate/ureidoglycolate dehydrogenase